jgi:hypothetical protein
MHLDKQHVGDPLVVAVSDGALVAVVVEELVADLEPI